MARQLPIWEVYHLAHPETIAMLASYQPDVICVACFSRIIPPAILDLPRLGCLNVHPSLLPMNRGPVPLFWTFREGRDVTGVTIHQMDTGIDSGDILAQAPLKVFEGTGHIQLESRCALVGGSLLTRTVWELYNGCATRVPQDETKSSYHSFPVEEDLVVHAQSWSARHVYNFICGVGSTWGPVCVEFGDRRWRVRTANSYSHELLETYRERREEHDELIVPCLDGHVVLVSVEAIS
jgi:methionyl-tRNA formyltransferase